MSCSRTDLQNFLNVLAKFGLEVGLNINISKTKCMTTNRNNPNLQLTIYNQEITQVTEFVYLSHMLSSNNNNGMVAVQHCIALILAAFHRNKEVLTSKQDSHHSKAKIFDTYISTSCVTRS